jgi:predicted RNase H-like nuclease
VDGCAAGWVAVVRVGSGLSLRVFSQISDLVAEYANADQILIDSPIGLPWAQTPIRPCDRLARGVLGKRKSSVFPVPCREALAASSIGEARKINLDTLVRSLTGQTWSIMKKIGEVDALLQSSPHCRAHVREIHPEVCFWGLAGCTPMGNAKRLAAGKQERLQLLTRFEPGIVSLVAKLRSEHRSDEVGTDDVLDAAVAFVTAEGRHGTQEVLCGMPSHDLTGLLMEMTYPRI